jgi:hypothetical protein
MSLTAFILRAFLKRLHPILSRMDCGAKPDFVLRKKVDLPQNGRKSPNSSTKKPAISRGPNKEK